MGYFPNGTAGMIYEEIHCLHCVHHTDPDGGMCAVMQAHMLFNYDDCNRENSILHLLIPMSKEVSAGDCRMFYPKGWDRRSSGKEGPS